MFQNEDISSHDSYLTVGLLASVWSLSAIRAHLMSLEEDPAFSSANWYQEVVFPVLSQLCLLRLSPLALRRTHLTQHSGTIWGRWVQFPSSLGGTGFVLQCPFCVVLSDPRGSWMLETEHRSPDVVGSALPPGTRGLWSSRCFTLLVRGELWAVKRGPVCV